MISLTWHGWQWKLNNVNRIEKENKTKKTEKQ